MYLSQSICEKTSYRNIKLKTEEKTGDRKRNGGRREGGDLIIYRYSKSLKPFIFLCLASNPFQDFFPSLTLINNKSATWDTHWS